MLRNLRNYGYYHDLRRQAKRDGMRLEDMELEPRVKPWVFRGRKENNPRSKKILQTWQRRLLKHMYWKHFIPVMDSDTLSPEYKAARSTMLEMWRMGEQRWIRDGASYRGPASEWSGSDAPPAEGYIDVDTEPPAEDEEDPGERSASPSPAPAPSLPVRVKEEGGGAGGTGAAASASSSSRDIPAASGASSAGAAAAEGSTSKRQKKR